MIKEKIEGILGRSVVLVHPKVLQNGDYTVIADPKTAEEDFQKLQAANLPEVERVELASGRFINIFLSKQFFADSLNEIIEKGNNFGKGEHAKGFKVMVEYTDPNPFKEFHIGHLMSNAIGEAVSRIIEWNGATVKRANWEGDVGIHVAKTLWGAQKSGVSANPTSTADFGKAYAIGAKAYEEDENAKAEITELNKKIYEKSDPELNKLYELGRRISLDSFEVMYEKLGTKFDYYFFESREGVMGKPIVEAHLEDGIFEKSDGAIVFKGEKYGLHTRVFINSKGLPTYEAKELGLNKEKFKVEPDLGLSIIVTGNEIRDYFKVLLKVISLIYPDIAKKTKHLPHGMLRLPTGKMSSRTGNVITAESLIEEVKKLTKGDEQVAIAAIKYMILRQGIGQDIVFDFEKSVSTEGDSGVYLQYAYVRSKSVLERPEISEFEEEKEFLIQEQQGILERMLYRFPEIVERAGAEYAPNLITTYLTDVASAFNNFYSHKKIINPNDLKTSHYRLALTKATSIVLKNGLAVLGMAAPERM